ncbi:hypothetical protein MPER_05693, partial [Moniliophthora perniciosa FA553]
MSSQGLHSLTTIIKRFEPLEDGTNRDGSETRLEAATSRLEDLAASNLPTSIRAEETKDIKEAPNPGSYVAPVAPPPPPSAPSTSMEQAPKSVVAYDKNVIEGKLKPFLELTRSFAGPNVVEI